MGTASIFVGDMTQEQANRLGPAIEQVQEWLGLKLKTGRCSFGFVVDLAKHVVMNTLDVFAIYDEIAILEHPEGRTTGTKGVRNFKNAPLAGLSYKHYFSAAFLLKNLQNELNYGNTVEKFFRDKVGQPVEQFLNELSHEVVIGNFHRRIADGRVTGEWLIFEESVVGNYYLTLANHTEGDDKIYARIMQYKSVDTEIAKTSAEHGK